MATPQPITVQHTTRPTLGYTSAVTNRWGRYIVVPGVGVLAPTATGGWALADGPDAQAAQDDVRGAQHRIQQYRNPWKSSADDEALADRMEANMVRTLCAAMYKALRKLQGGLPSAYDIADAQDALTNGLAATGQEVA